jgi:ribosomal protein S18 acetylase RimI-like enzyme
VNNLLDNPVYQGLISGDQHLSLGTPTVKFFDPAVSPFVGFDEDNIRGFEELYEILPEGRNILYATRRKIATPGGWELKQAISGLQLVFDVNHSLQPVSIAPKPLGQEHVPEMVALATLTKPGPFGTRTIDFGHYYGIFENDKLVAMTGQRLHVQQYSEVSAVCTHPDHLGKGYATLLVQHQVQLILHQGKIPFLHVRDDNRRAIELYQRLGFVISGNMNFYFMRRL